jgi:cation:H+ antiporter
MLIALLEFFASAAVIIASGIGMARSADVLSRVTGLGQLLAGALLVAVATSLPDLLVGINAVRNGWVDLAVGDVLGAALMNLLVLAVLDMLNPSRGRMLSRMAAAHALSGTMGMTLLASVGIALFLPDAIDVSVGGIGLGLWFVVGAYFLGVRLIFFDQQFAAKEVEKGVKHVRIPTDIGKPLAGYLISAGLIFIAAPILARSANQLAELTGLGNSFFGTVFLPVSTTLPELVAGLTALRMRAFPLIVGNAFGSLAFNLLLLAPMDFAYDGSLMAAASRVHVVTCFAAILVIAVAVMGQLYHAERRISFVEPDALLVIMLVFGAFGLIYRLG